MTGMDDEAPDASTGTDKIMAIAGLAVAVVLALISVDLLRGKKPEAASDDDG